MLYRSSSDCAYTTRDAKGCSLLARVSSRVRPFVPFEPYRPPFEPASSGLSLIVYRRFPSVVYRDGLADMSTLNYQGIIVVLWSMRLGQVTLFLVQSQLKPCMYDNDVFFLGIIMDFTDKHCIVTSDTLVSALYNRLFAVPQFFFLPNAHVEISFDYHPPSAAAFLPAKPRILTEY